MSNKPNYKTSRKYKCPYCEYKASRSDLCDHVDKKHMELIPEGYTPARAVYDSINGKNHGTCMVCKKDVYKWNDKINRYYNLCDDPKCRAKVREVALQRHMKVYNKPTLLNDADHQEKMLANRKISGSYTFTDGGKITYTGSYEKSALEFMDKVLQIPSKDIQAPGPVLEYKYGGKTHKWITDIYYIPGNLLIEVKDGGSNPNNRTMTSYREKQAAKEEMVTNLGTFNYLRLTNNDFAQLLSIFADMKNEALESTNPKATVHINESIDKSFFDKNYKPKERYNLSSFKKIKFTDYALMDYGLSKRTIDGSRELERERGDKAFYFVDEKNKKLVAYIGVLDHAINLIVMDEYQGHGLSEQVLDFAVKHMGAYKLYVYKDNEVAQHLYNKYGFKKVSENKDEIFMTLDGRPFNESIDILENDRKYIEEVFNSMNRNDIKYYGSSSPCLDDVLWYKIEFEGSKPIGFILIRQRTKNPYCGFVEICVDKRYRNRGIASKLLSQAIDFGENNLSTLTYNVIKGNEASDKIARKNKFKLYKSYAKYNEYYMDFRKKFNEEVGGLPVNRPPEAYVVPYSMGSVFDGYAYSDSDLGNIIVDNGDGKCIPISESEFFSSCNTGPVMYYKGKDIREKMNEIHDIIRNNKIESPMHIANILCGFNLRKANDIVLCENFEYYDNNRQKRIFDLLENGVQLKFYANNEDIVRTIGENAFIHQTPNGYYASNSLDNGLFLASEMYMDVDDEKLTSTAEYIDSLADGEELELYGFTSRY